MSRKKGNKVPEHVDPYREFVRRSHHLLGAYLSMHAWMNDLKCVIIDRDDIVAFWGLRNRVEKRRRLWLKDDIKPYFPHTRPLFYTNQGEKFASIYLSKIDFPLGTFDAAMSDTKRAKLLSDKDIPSAEVRLPEESEILATLTSAIHGLTAFPINHAKRKSSD